MTYLRAAAGEQVRREPERAQLADAVLRRLRLLFAHDAQNRDQAHVDQAEVVAACGGE